MQIKEKYESFQTILSDTELATLFKKHDVEDVRKRKLSIYHFFWLIILSAIEPGSRGSIFQLIGFFSE